MTQPAALFVNWQQFRQQQAELAEAGRALLYQFGVGLAFLGTVRRDGGPRMHPVCPLIADAGLYVFLEPSPKRSDLHRDRRYALHSFPSPHNEDAFYLTGEAVPEPDPACLAMLRQQLLSERGWTDRPPPTWGAQEVFELLIDGCLHTRTVGHGDFNPMHTIWRRA